MNTTKIKILLATAFVLTLLNVAITPVQAAPGDLDLSFGSGGRVSSAGFFGNALANQSDGKIIAAGYSSTGTDSAATLERYNIDGSPDTSFGTNGRVVTNPGVGPGVCNIAVAQNAVGVTIQSGGKILAAASGYLTSDKGFCDRIVFFLVKYNIDGSLDTSFGIGGISAIPLGFGEGTVQAMAIQADGKIVAVGYIRSATSWDFLTARYDPNGTLDTSFGSGGLITTSFSDGPLGIDEAKDLAIQSDGKIVAAGGTRSYPSSSSFALVRYNTDGSIDRSFGNGGKVVTPFGNSFGAKQIVIQTDGKIVAAATGGSPNTGFALTKYNTDGSLDTSFGKGGKVLTLFVPGYGGAGTVATQPDGKIIATGYKYEGGNPSIALARYSSDGSLDSSFGAGGKVFTPFGDVSVGNDATIQSGGKIVVLASTSYPAPAYGLFRYQGGSSLTVNNVEELYSAVNNPQNAGSQIIIAPGVYMLSVNDPTGTARPNAGRLDLQQNMSMQGVNGDRGAVIIDAANLPTSSFNSAPPIPLTAAIRMGRGTNAVEWLTARNAVNGNANIGTDLASTATTIRVAHVASSNSVRGLDLRNFGAAQAGRVMNAEIVDNDFYNNQITAGESIRIANNNGANGGIINATLALNRSYNNYHGFIVTNNQSNSAVTTVFSSGNRFFENGVGGVVLGGVSAGSNVADGNTVNFTANGDVYENNNGVNGSGFPDLGGLVILGGENTSFPNGTSNNTVNVNLRNCRFVNNQVNDIAAFGARSSPESVGSPGTGNTVTLYLRGITPKFRTQMFADSIPVSPGSMNSVVLTGLR